MNIWLINGKNRFFGAFLHTHNSLKQLLYRQKQNLCLFLQFSIQQENRITPSWGNFDDFAWQNLSETINIREGQIILNM